MLTEHDLGPCPYDPDPSNVEALRDWTLWCYKRAIIRFSRLVDDVETMVFHTMIEELRARVGDDEVADFITRAFPPDSAPYEAGLRPVSPEYATALAQHGRHRPDPTDQQCAAWVYAVKNGDTVLGLAEWVEHQEDASDTR